MEVLRDLAWFAAVPPLLPASRTVRLPRARADHLRAGLLMASTDRRLLVIEEEFARVLGVARREGNTLSATMRDAWGSGNLATMTRREPLKATGAHISVIGHTTRMEMLKRTEDVEIANGFVNRFLIAAVKRSQLLPSGGALPAAQLDALSTDIGATLREIRRFGRLGRTPEAEERWTDLYSAMANDDDGGLAAAATARGEAQTLRLSVAYALLDRSRVIEVNHLEAAYAVWTYCRMSARWLFGNSLGDPVADRIAEALKTAPYGLDRTALRDLLNRHQSAARIETALDLLELRGLIKIDTEPTDGRTRQIVVPTSLLCAESDLGDGSTSSEGLGRQSRLGRNPLDEWPKLDSAARHGLAGRVLDVLGPHTEADPAALLLDFLVCFGSATGSGPHAFADGAQHPARLFALLVGETAKARKGTSRSNISRLMAPADPEWAAHRVLSGLSSGEGLIAAVSDPEETTA